VDTHYVLNFWVSIFAFRDVRAEGGEEIESGRVDGGRGVGAGMALAMLGQPICMR